MPPGLVTVDAVTPVGADTTHPAISLDDPMPDTEPLPPDTAIDLDGVTAEGPGPGWHGARLTASGSPTHTRASRPLASTPSTDPVVIPLDAIELAASQPRQAANLLAGLSDLITSIRLHGLLQPILVVGQPGRAKPYRLIDGHRRVAAVTQLASENPERWQAIPATMTAATAAPYWRQIPTPLRHFMLAGTANVVRKDLTHEEKHQLATLAAGACGGDVVEAGRMIGYSRATMYRLLREAPPPTAPADVPFEEARYLRAITRLLRWAAQDGDDSRATVARLLRRAAVAVERGHRALGEKPTPGPASAAPGAAPVANADPGGTRHAR